MQGNMNSDILDAMRFEHFQATKDGSVDHLVKVKLNLAVALIDDANRLDNRDLSQNLKLYGESEQLLLSILERDPTHPGALLNLNTTRKNRDLRGEFKMCNPHITHLEHPECEHVVLRRLNWGQLSATLFTCDKETDMGLLWMSEPEDLSVDEWESAFLEGEPSRLALAYDARALVWRDDLCWASTACGNRKATEYMLFHCIGRRELWQQMALSRARGVLLPLLGARGGPILADRMQSVEKNWAPFAVGDALYIVYAARPFKVLRCDWRRADDAGRDRPALLRCETAQQQPQADAGGPAAPKAAEGYSGLRGSSTAVQIPASAVAAGGGAEPEFLALGHVRGGGGGNKYQSFLYRFAGAAPPFRVLGFSPFFQARGRDGWGIEGGLTAI
jgi:hypothetical protein